MQTQIKIKLNSDEFPETYRFFNQTFPLLGIRSQYLYMNILRDNIGFEIPDVDQVVEKGVVVNVRRLVDEFMKMLDTVFELVNEDIEDVVYHDDDVHLKGRNEYVVEVMPKIEKGELELYLTIS